MTVKDDIKVDIYNLHTELAGQPGLYRDYAEKAADAVAEMMKANEQLSVVKTEGKRKIDEKKAELDADIRINPSEYGLVVEPGKKPTETAISSAIILEPAFKNVCDQVAEEIKIATDTYIEAVRNKELLDGTKIAFSHRKTSLEKEVELWLGGYYSDPKIPKPFSDEMGKQVQEKMKEALNPAGDGATRRRRPVSE